MAVGDARFAAKCRRRIAELRAGGRTVLLVSHDLGQVHATCDRVLWLDDGRRDAGRNLLAPIYGWFTEGFDTADLKEAKALLDQLA